MIPEDTFAAYFTETQLAFVQVYFREIQARQTDYPILGERLPNLLRAIELAGDLGLDTESIDATVSLSSFLETRALIDLATSLLENAIAVATRTNDGVRLAVSLSTLGNILIAGGEYERARQILQEAEAVPAVSESPELAATIQLRQGRLHSMTGDYAAAYDSFRICLELTRSLGNMSRLVGVLFNLGANAGIRQDSESARSYLEEALILVNESGNQRQLAEVLNNYGNLLNRIGELEKAREYWMQGLDVARKSRIDNVRPMLLMNLGVQADDSGDHEAAEEYWLEGVEVCRETGNRANLSILLANLGFIEVGRDDFERANSYMLESLALAREIGHLEYVCTALKSLGYMETSRGRYVMSEEYLHEGLELAKMLDHPFRISQMLEEWGELYLKQAKYDRAQPVLEEALDYANKSKSEVQIAAILFLLAQAYLALGNEPLARQHAKDSLAIYERHNHHQAPAVQTGFLPRFLMAA